MSISKSYKKDQVLVFSKFRKREKNENTHCGEKTSSYESRKNPKPQLYASAYYPS